MFAAFLTRKSRDHDIRNFNGELIRILPASSTELVKHVRLTIDRRAKAWARGCLSLPSSGMSDPTDSLCMVAWAVFAVHAYGALFTPIKTYIYA